jgi:hypothetical protein
MRFRIRFFRCQSASTSSVDEVLTARPSQVVLLRLLGAQAARAEDILRVSAARRMTVPA